MKNLAKHLVWLTAVLQLNLFSAPLNLFVAPNGKDTWSGRMAEPRAGATDGPFATLPAALNAARAARQNNQASDGITIWMRGGTYELSKPILLTPEDSGTDGQKPLTIAAWQNEKPV